MSHTTTKDAAVAPARRELAHRTPVRRSSGSGVPPRRRPGRTAPALGVAALGAAAAVPAAADAGSIAYVRAGDVWLSTDDGSRQHRVTATGGYSDVSQADDGTMIALHGVRLHRIDRSGTVTADFDTPVSDVRPEGERVFYGPFDPAISPNGRRVAYTYYSVGKGSAPGCRPPTCQTTVTEGGTGYSHADRQTAWDEPGLGRHSGWRNASWVDDDTTMLSDPTHLPNPDVLVDPVGDGRPGRDGITLDWFSDAGTPHLGGGELTRTRDKLAFQAGEGDTAVRIYRLSAFYPTLPQACYAYANAGGGSTGTPTWSPDGARLAWEEGDGVRVVDVPAQAAGCTTDGASPESRVLLPGASRPDWGPADVPAGPGRTPGAGPDGTAPGTTTPGGATAPPGGGAPGSAAPTGPRRVVVRVTSASLRGGVRLRVTLPGPGRLSATAKAGRTTLAALPTTTVARSGTRTALLRITPGGRRALRAARSRRAVVAVTFRTAGKPTLRATRSRVAVAGGRR